MVRSTLMKSRSIALFYILGAHLMQAAEGNPDAAPAGVPLEEPAKGHLPADFYAGSAAGLIRLDSEEGRALLKPGSPDYAPLLKHWIPQLKSHCGACSSVITMNSLLPGAGFTQDSIFNPATAPIISQETVYKIGFTLEELTRLIQTVSNLDARRFHAGPGPEQHGEDVWREALKANLTNPGDRIICNFATRWLIDRQNLGGHFSIVADYNEAADKVLILEVSGGRPSYWVSPKEMWAAMNQVDPISKQVRGWIVVSRKE